MLGKVAGLRHPETRDVGADDEEGETQFLLGLQHLVGRLRARAAARRGFHVVRGSVVTLKSSTAVLLSVLV